MVCYVYNCQKLTSPASLPKNVATNKASESIESVPKTPPVAPAITSWPQNEHVGVAVVKVTEPLYASDNVAACADIAAIVNPSATNNFFILLLPS